MHYALCDADVKRQTAMKLVCVGKREQRVVGLHIVGDGADATGGSSDSSRGRGPARSL